MQAIDALQTVGELVTAKPARARVFEHHRIDYCCGGKIPLAEACERRGADLDIVLADLASLDQSADDSTEADWFTMPLDQLIHNIITVHHDHLREELPRLAMLTAKVARVHGDRFDFLFQIDRVFAGLHAELVSHMQKEEGVLFPWIRALEAGEGMPDLPADAISSPIACMEAEHDDAGAALQSLHDLTDGYSPPPEACNSWRVLFAGLDALETDMHLHIHKENNILFPRAMERARAT